MHLYSNKGLRAWFFSVLVVCILNPLAAFAQDSALSAESGWSFRSYTTALAGLAGTSEMNLRIPVLMGVEVTDLQDTWGDARSNGRTHEGIDIMAPRGTPVVSPTHAVVMNIGYGANGGNYIYTLNAGGDRYYFAHLDGYAPGIVSGKVVEAGDVLGYVGNTGNASGGAPHLHFGIYNGPATNPFPRLTRAFTTSERVAALEKMVSQSSTPETEANAIAAKYRSFLKNAQSQGITLTATLINALGGATHVTTTATASKLAVSPTLSRNLTLGSKGEDVRTLQKFLNTHGAVIASAGAGSPGNETTYFGPATRAALASYQRMKGINPTSGYFGPITRSLVAKESTVLVASNN